MGSWFSIAIACSFLALAGCAAHAGLPSYAVVPDFTLTDQTGAQFDSASKLHDVVWIADFIFTNCGGPCPRMSSQMHQVQTALSGVEGVRLVSFTVDPERDTPQVLAEYSKKFQADPARWFFLTGAQASLQHLSRDVFTLGDVDGKLEHSTRFVLIDRKSRVRGYYLTSEPDAIPRIVADAKSLVPERF
jgi:cytochrome oxidase Cu insertion factor (SCO1/SenC/PrrC family)